MNILSNNSMANIEFQLTWHSTEAFHRDCYFGQKVNLWRDLFPSALYNELLGKSAGEETIPVTLSPDEMVPPTTHQAIFTVKSHQFNRRLVRGMTTEPRFGRFYPRRMLQQFTELFEEDARPFRCIAVNETVLQVDFNHSLANKPIKISAKIHDISEKNHEPGGRAADWMTILTEKGVGFQARYHDQPTDFFADNPYKRVDDREDTIFYQYPRLVNHIDNQAIAAITRLYGQLLKPATQVLDLMSSWRSHLPENWEFAGLIGLGLNQEELEQNPRLTQRIVHDLNQTPQLPFADETFDAVVCTVSIEYLTQPILVFNEIARILKPEGYFVVTFSNRWFPPKAIQIWSQLHEFERLGLVLEYFLQSQRYKKICQDRPKINIFDKL